MAHIIGKEAMRMHHIGSSNPYHPDLEIARAMIVVQKKVGTMRTGEEHPVQRLVLHLKLQGTISMSDWANTVQPASSNANRNGL
jgi:hypothetical protein